MTLKVIHRLQVFSNAIRQTFVQYGTGITKFQLTACLPPNPECFDAFGWMTRMAFGCENNLCR